jgi:site-specific recombinase XerD
MNKTDLITRYKHQLILRNYSKNTVNAYLSSLNNFLQYVKKKGLNDVTATQLESYFYHCKNELNYSYSAGLWLGEILNIKISDIDSDPMQIRIPSQNGSNEA